MVVERKMIHDIIELIPESDISKIYAILNAYMAVETEDTLTEEQELRMTAGFEQISRGEHITVNDYLAKRGISI